MAVQDDIRRLSEMQGIYLGLNLYGACMAWYEGRLQQASVGYFAQVAETARL
jgi:hypothetical protein